MTGRLARRAAALLAIAGLCGPGVSQVPCASFVDSEQLQQLMDPVRHQTKAHQLPLPGEPFVFLVLGSQPEVEEVLCRDELRAQLAGRAVSSVQSVDPSAAEALEGVKILALRGSSLLARYSQGDVGAWVAGVLDGSAIELPPMESAAHVASWQGDQWGRFVDGAWALLSVGDAERASTVLVRAWRLTEGQQVCVGVRYAYLVPLLGGLLELDRERTQSILNQLLDEALALTREYLGDELSAGDAVALCRLTGRLEDLAGLIDELSRSRMLQSNAAHYIRDDAFDALADSPHVFQALLVIDGPLDKYLEMRLAEMDKENPSASTATEPAVSDDERMENWQALARRCIRVAILAGEDEQSNAVASVLREEFQIAGVVATVRTCRELGPPNELGKRMGAFFLRVPEAGEALQPGEAAEIRAWLGN